MKLLKVGGEMMMSNMIGACADEIDEFETEKGEEAVAIRPYEVDCLPNDYNITTLMSLIARGYMKIPSFQRNYVWKLDMASKFIESIIIGLPIPQLFLFERARNNFLVIDGQQRLITIYLFKKQRFPKNDVGRSIIRKYLSRGSEIPDEYLQGENFDEFKLKLPVLDTQKSLLNGLKYDTLSTIKDYDFKGEFDYNRTIRTITIRQVTPAEDDSSMFEIFSRLNSGGITLKQQEIRMCMYYSPFYELLVSKLNLNKEWRKFLGKEIPDLHMNEIEVLVRAFALLEMSANYKSPLRNFLNEYSKNAMGFNEEKISELSKVYDTFWESCSKLCDDAFRNEKNKFVRVLFESVFVTVCEIIKNNELNGRKINPESIIKLKQDTQFISSSQGNTAGTTSVNNRLKRAREIIELQ